MRTRALDRTRFVNYRGRASEFFDGMKDEADMERFNGAALLGIHAAIALTDAVVVHHVGTRAADEQHAEAVRLLKKVCCSVKVDTSGADRLSSILARKTAVAYDEHFIPTDSEDTKRIRLNVERFFTWAYKSFVFLSSESAQGM